MPSKTTPVEITSEDLAKRLYGQIRESRGYISWSDAFAFVGTRGQRQATRAVYLNRLVADGFIIVVWTNRGHVTQWEDSSGTHHSEGTSFCYMGENGLPTEDRKATIRKGVDYLDKGLLGAESLCWVFTLDRWHEYETALDQLLTERAERSKRDAQQHRESITGQAEKRFHKLFPDEDFRVNVYRHEGIAGLSVSLLLSEDDLLRILDALEKP